LHNSTLSKEQKKEIQTNIRNSFKVKTPRSGKTRIALRVYSSPESFKIRDYHKNTSYVGNEIWIIVQRRGVKTLLVGESSLTKNPEYVKKRFDVTNVFYSVEDLKSTYTRLNN
jgi:hypothetical protein